MLQKQFLSQEKELHDAARQYTTTIYKALFHTILDKSRESECQCAQTEYEPVGQDEEAHERVYRCLFTRRGSFPCFPLQLSNTRSVA